MKKSNLFLSVVCILQFAICNLQPVTSFAQYTKLYDFAGTDGSNPNGSLISDGTFLYGTTYSGGINGMGVIFKIKPDGTGYSKLLDFAGAANGSYPKGSLIYDGTFLYGMTFQGGTSDKGVIFKIKPDGTGYAKLLDFTGAATGGTPYGDLVYDGIFLYGMTYQGGASSGVLFKIKPDGTGFSKLLDFTGAANGANPSGSLIYDGTFLHGMTYLGGTYNVGTIFKIKPDGTGFLKMHDFSDTPDGSDPYGSLVSDGTSLYGMTMHGGSSIYGTVFQIKPDGTGYSKLLEMSSVSSAATGTSPRGSLISDGGFLYGMTYGGGANSKGVFFKIKSDGTVHSKLLDFTGTANGSYPAGSLISDGIFLYGMTSQGGANNIGVIFKYQYSTAPTCTASITGDTTICAGQNTTLSASGGTTYVWNTMETTTSITVSPSASTTYTVTAATGTCFATATTVVTVNQLPIVTASATAATVCAGVLDTLTGGGALNYVWTGGVTNGIGFIPSSTTTYIVTGTDANGCSDTAAVTVTVITPPATPAITVNMSTLASSSATGNQWYLNGTPISGAVSQFYTASQNGFYTVCVTDANGCSSCSAPYNFSTTGIAKNDISNESSVYPNPSNGKFWLSIPSGHLSLSPSRFGDGRAEVEIYNVWGEQVYASPLTPLSSGKGTGGEIIDLSVQPDGIYFIRVRTEEGTTNRKLIIQR